MAIVQISKMQQRAGNLVDLPQLDDAEFGWASDEKRLFIGKSTPNENIEVLTSYSNISFSQINGSNGGNFDITNAQTGQLLTYVANNNTWINYSGNITPLGNTKIQLGDVSNLSMNGGAIGYVLSTDGTGNLSWTPKGSLYTPIKAISNANPMVMTVANTVPYTNNTVVTISGVLGANANTIVNGKSFYIQIANDFSTSGNVSLYTSSGNGSPASGTGLTATANTGAATSQTGSTGSGSTVGGSNTTVLFNNQNISDGSTDFTFDFGASTKVLTVNGNANVGNLNATGTVSSSRLTSNIATGTAPLTITSTTRVGNLNVSYSNVSDFEVVTAQTTGTFYPVFVSGNTTANYALGSNANISFNVATGSLIVPLLTVIGNANVGNIGAATGVFTGNVTVSSGNITSLNANLGNLAQANYLQGTLTTAAQPNITSVGLLSTLTVGNATANTIFGNGTITATGNIIGANVNTAGKVTASVLVSNVTTGTSPLTITSTTLVTNLNANLLNGLNTSSASAVNSVVTRDASANFGANVITANIFTGVLSTAAQPNITSVGTLTSLGVNGTVTATAFTANTGIFTGNGSGLSAVAGANITGTVANATFATTSGSATTAGTVTTAAQPNITSVGTLSSLTVTANTATGGIKTDNYYYANGVSISFAGSYSNSNVAAYLPTFSGTVGATALTTGANTTAGTVTGNWTLTAGSKLQATYADLAEYYEADEVYMPGTVLEFGGDKEVTIAEDGTTRVAGVVSTNPAYAMNANCQGIATAIALQGRVPTKVRGIIRKGDMMVSAGNGYARPAIAPTMGSVIGKALENFNGVEGVIEVAVGRL